MKKIIQKLTISLGLIIIMVLIISPLVSAEGEEGMDTIPPTGYEENNNTPSEESSSVNNEDDNSITEKNEDNFFQKISVFAEEIGLTAWFEQEFLPALPQSIWSLLLSLLVFLSTYKKNKQGATDIQASIVSMGLAKESMDSTNNKIEELIKNEVTSALAQIATLVQEVKDTNQDMKNYKADLKLEIDNIKQFETAIKDMLVTAFTNTAELVANGQAETIAKVASKYDKEKSEQKETV